MANSVRITGLADVERKLRALPKTISGRRGGPLRFGMLKAAQFMRDRAKENAVFKRGFSTGNLRNQIVAFRDSRPPSGIPERFFVTVRRSRQKIPGVRGSSFGSGRGAFYAHFVEFGTVKQAAQPFMRPAFEANKAKSLDVFVQSITRRLDLELRKLQK